MVFTFLHTNQLEKNGLLEKIKVQTEKKIILRFSFHFDIIFDICYVTIAKI